MTPAETKVLADAATAELNKFVNRSAGQHLRTMRKHNDEWDDDALGFREEFENERNAMPDARDLDYWLKLEK